MSASKSSQMLLFSLTGRHDLRTDLWQSCSEATQRLREGGGEKKQSRAEMEREYAKERERERGELRKGRKRQDRTRESKKLYTESKSLKREK